MDVLSRLASSLDRQDEAPNTELAEQLVEAEDEDAIEILVENLANKNKDVRYDCIKVLYEIGARRPSLISKYSQDFLDLLTSKDNRLVWGGMTALDAIVPERPGIIRKALPSISAAANGESVIARDHAVSIFVNLAKSDKEAFRLLQAQLATCPTNQLPMYAEMAETVADAKTSPALLKVLRSRLGAIDKESKKKRVEKVITKLERRG